MPTTLIAHVRLLAILLGLAGFGVAATAEAPAGGARLVMFERADCPFCRAWHRTIGPIYPKTDEGKRAPLRRVDLAEPRPTDLRSISGIVYTPTFVLVADGREIGRIVGYGSEESFWAILGELLEKAYPANRGGLPRDAPSVGRLGVLRP